MGNKLSSGKCGMCGGVTYEQRIIGTNLPYSDLTITPDTGKKQAKAAPDDHDIRGACVRCSCPVQLAPLPPPLPTDKHHPDLLKRIKFHIFRDSMPYELTGLGPKEILTQYIVPYFLTGSTNPTNPTQPQAQPPAKTGSTIDTNTATAEGESPSSHGERVLKDIFRSTDYRTCPPLRLHELIQQYLQRTFEEYTSNRAVIIQSGETYRIGSLRVKVSSCYPSIGYLSKTTNISLGAEYTNRPLERIHILPCAPSLLKDVAPTQLSPLLLNHIEFNRQMAEFKQNNKIPTQLQRGTGNSGVSCLVGSALCRTPYPLLQSAPQELRQKISEKRQFHGNEHVVGLVGGQYASHGSSVFWKGSITRHNDHINDLLSKTIHEKAELIANYKLSVEEYQHDAGVLNHASSDLFKRLLKPYLQQSFNKHFHKQQILVIDPEEASYTEKQIAALKKEHNLRKHEQSKYGITAGSTGDNVHGFYVIRPPPVQSGHKTSAPNGSGTITTTSGSGKINQSADQLSSSADDQCLYLPHIDLSLISSRDLFIERILELVIEMKNAYYDSYPVPAISTQKSMKSVQFQIISCQPPDGIFNEQTQIFINGKPLYDIKRIHLLPVESTLPRKDRYNPNIDPTKVGTAKIKELWEQFVAKTNEQQISQHQKEVFTYNAQYEHLPEGKRPKAPKLSPLSSAHMKALFQEEYGTGNRANADRVLLQQYILPHFEGSFTRLKQGRVVTISGVTMQVVNCEPNEGLVTASTQVSCTGPYLSDDIIKGTVVHGAIAQEARYSKAVQEARQRGVHVVAATDPLLEIIETIPMTPEQRGILTKYATFLPHDDCVKRALVATLRRSIEETGGVKNINYSNFSDYLASIRSETPSELCVPNEVLSSLPCFVFCVDDPANTSCSVQPDEITADTRQANGISKIAYNISQQSVGIDGGMASESRVRSYSTTSTTSTQQLSSEMMLLSIDGQPQDTTQPATAAAAAAGSHSHHHHHQELSGDVTTCRICFLEYEERDILRMLPCMHRFHQGCVDTWFARHQTCPLCKLNVVTKVHGEKEKA